METTEKQKTTRQQGQQKQPTEECCPKFNPKKWDNKTFNWDDKHFIKASVPTLFHRPFKKIMGKRIMEMMQQAETSKKLDKDKEEILLLFNDPSAFKSNMYLSVTDQVPNAKNTELSGTFITKVFDGPYKDIPKFFKRMDAYLSNQGKEADDYYVHYAYCPKCAEKFGHNYMVLFAELDD